MAKRLGISQRAYAFYEDENNARIPKPKRLAQLGEVLNIPIKTLMKHYGAEIEEIVLAGGGNNETPPNDNGQKVVLDLNVLLELLKSAQQEKSRLMDVIDANLTTLASTQQIILAHVKAGHKWEAKKYGGGAEAKEKSILVQLNKFADEYLPDGEPSDKNVQGRK